MSSPGRTSSEEPSVENDGSNAESEDEESIGSKEGDTDSDGSSSRESGLINRPFDPPQGFKPIKLQNSSSSTITSLLSNFDGKQVFHISAPASLPLSSVRDLSIPKALRGEPLINHDGDDYGILPGNQQHPCSPTLLRYDASTGTYHDVSALNIKSYQIQKLIRLPKSSEHPGGKSLDTALGVQTPKMPQPQPKHMKMRFRPVGSGNGAPETIGTESEESDAEETAFRYPKDSDAERGERKRKNTNPDQNQKAPETNGSLQKKSKKRSSSSNITPKGLSETRPSASSLQMSHETQEERGREEDSHRNKKSRKHKSETSQERKARRKAEKRQK
jgi:hypothetical protein